MILKKSPSFNLSTLRNIFYFFVSLFGVFFFIFLYYFYLFPDFGPFTNYKSGIYEKRINISLSNFIPDSDIRYTLDSSVPEKNSFLYSNPINIDQTTILRARAFRDEKPIGKEVVLTFLYPNRKLNLPVVSLILDPKDLYDAERGIYHINNFDKRGKDSHREGYFSLFSHPSDFNKSINSKLSNIRIYGNKSREFPRKSFKICFKNSTLDFKLFSDSNLTNFPCILLRNSGNDWNSTLFKDALVHKIVSRNSDLHTQNYQPVVLFLNNEYFGIYNIREYISSATLSTKYQGSSDDYAVLFQERSKNGLILKESGTESDIKLYKELLELSKDLDNPESKKRFEDLIDIDEFIDYHIFQTYFENFDYNDQNTKPYRYNGFIKFPNSKRDGKFRWLLYDTDGTFGSLTKRFSIFNVMNGLRDSENRKWPYILFKNIFAHHEYQERFVNRYTYLLNTVFREENINKIIDEFKNGILVEVPYHIKRWENFVYYDKNRKSFIKPLKNIDDWLVEVEGLKKYNAQRNIQVFQELDESFKFGGFYEIEIINNYSSMGLIDIQGIKVPEERWAGRFFNLQTLEIKPIPYNGYEFVSWDINSKNIKSPIFRKKLP